MARNLVTASCNMHVDVMYKYLNQHVDSNTIKIAFVKSIENDNNIASFKFSGSSSAVSLSLAAMAFVGRSVRKFKFSHMAFSSLSCFVILFASLL